MPDKSVTSGNGLNPDAGMPMPHWGQLTIERNVDAELTILRHSGISAFIYDCSMSYIARIRPSAAVYGRAGCTTFHYMQFGRALSIPFTTTNNSRFKYRNIGLSGIQSVRYRNEQRIPMPEPVRFWNKGTQSGAGMLRYRSEIQDAGMPMPSYGREATHLNSLIYIAEAAPAWGRVVAGGVLQLFFGHEAGKVRHRGLVTWHLSVTWQRCHFPILSIIIKKLNWP